ncbi:TIGR04255 family protein [Solirubrobacter ginsenosidimutans]|uniref:TIGR04255 family protein n=1 Tax=Solirubrobacter ginsenosidimutans TaxID=490573 RepID=A0A9X3RYF4_9ACTN|nr:TIGR04255 family protein [Solirubrobacter ginsenosidimutans]MDA0159570.1 TIGR04255 family protein [Solirubrobacter ginsenosidimutans]
MEAIGQIRDLVTFERPPLNEVYLSVQFATDVSDEAVALAEFWPLIRADFPTLERHPALPPVEETFDVPPKVGPPNLPFRIGTGAMPQRYWFVSADSTRLVQVQPDRFLFNWRRVRPDDEYPRFRALVPEFERLFEAFVQVLSADQRKAATAAWAEVGYINHVDAPDELRPGGHISLDRIFTFVSKIDATAFDPVEDMQLQVRSTIRDDGDAPLGRIYLSATPAYRNADQMPIYVVELIARGRPGGSEPKDLANFFARGREMVVDAFCSVTTTEMHDAWGLRTKS